MGIYALWGSPQSGKTTLAVNLAYAASRSDKTVCLISPVAYSELSAFLGLRIPEKQSLSAALRNDVGIKNTVYAVDELFFILAAPVTTDAFDDNYSSEQVKALLAQARVAFDIVIVDCPSETNNLIAAWSMNKADKILLCLGGYVSGVMWYKANKKALLAAQSKTTYISSAVTSDFDFEAMHRLLGCTPSFRLPYIREAALLQNENRLLFKQTTKQGKAYASVIKNLCGVISK